ncbi:MAG: SurA N-terminal domain-containing protein [Pseudomonadota bacterium]
MLQNIRSNVQGTAAKVIIGLIVVSFALFGIESVLFGGSGASIAEVNGQEIGPLELQQAVETLRRQMISGMGDNLDPAMLEEERLAPQAIDSLIRRTLLMQSAEDMGLTVSNQEVSSLIASMGQFQQDGVFSPELYRNVLAGAGYTPAFFKVSLAEDMVVNQLRSGLAGSEFATPSELAVNAGILGEQRDVRFMMIPSSAFADDSPIGESDIDAYYAEHQGRFMTPESVDLEYIQLSPDDLRQPVDEASLLAAYEDAIQGDVAATENRVSHILLVNDETGTSAEKLTQAQDELAQGTPFAEVAESFSDDLASARRGGDLGYSTGDAFPTEIESAIATLPAGEVSKPVVSDAGTHLLLVTERRDLDVSSFEELRPQLEEALQLEEARAELLLTVEALRDLVFNADGLAAPARELGLEVQSIEGVTRSQSDGVFANPVLLDTAFSEEVLGNGHNSDVVELAGEQFVVLRVTTHHQPETLPVDDVREEIVTSLQNEATRQAVQAEAEALLADLRAGKSLTELGEAAGYPVETELGVDRRNTTMSPLILRRTFELPAPPAGQGLADFILTPQGDAVVMELLAVVPGNVVDLEPVELDMLQRQLSNEYSGLVDNEFQQGLRNSADISVM